MTFARGDVVVERYRLEERLGAGSFGEVWRASQLAHGEDVGRSCAIKLMRLVRDARGWLDEVRALQLARNKHAGATIPEILDANVWQDHAYIAMELLDGATLAARIAEGPIAWRRALVIAAQIAQALAAAHAEGVIHRDLKPQNVILADATRACVIDWGIARLSAPPPRGTAPARAIEAEPPVLAHGARATVDGTEAEPPVLAHGVQRAQLVGTPGYIAPELYEGAPPGPAVDAFALGVVLYEMLTGRLPQAVEPFRREPGDAGAVRAYRAALDRATQDRAFVALRDRRDGLPREVVELVGALLADDPAARPVDLRGAIERANVHPYGIPDPPYAGLGRLGVERAGLFLGQDDAIAHVLARLEGQRGVLLWGPSGSGKSSLAIAGVGGAADRRLFLDKDGWTTLVVRPRDAALKLAARAGAGPDRARIGHVVVIDQLEEVVDLDDAAREMFCGGVLALLEGRAPVRAGNVVLEPADPVRVIATIRDDLEWRVDREVPALRPLLECRVIVKGVDANFARSIIGEPARAAGFEVEELAAVAREVEDRLSADPAKLPVVQFALSEWWERRDRERRCMPITAWRELGGVDGTLSFVAERFYGGLSPGDQHRLRALFVRFFSQRTQRSLAASEVTSDEQRLVDELVRLRLLGRRERKGTPPSYEVEHEALVDNWARLSAWLHEARDARALLDELERDAAGWAQTRDAERLWKKRRLDAGEDLALRGYLSSQVSAEGRAFLAAGRSAARRGFVTVVAGLAVVLVAAAIATVWQLDRLRTARNEAQTAEKRAEANRARAEDETRAAVAARADAEKQQRFASDQAAKAEAASQKAETLRRFAEEELVRLRGAATPCKPDDRVAATEKRLAEALSELDKLTAQSRTELDLLRGRLRLTQRAFDDLRAKCPAP